MRACSAVDPNGITSNSVAPASSSDFTWQRTVSSSPTIALSETRP
ncbi:hypothetical protein QRX60_47950 [Amycolatopsis mongoliensis]|uniref:Uncharacterized protein n=1 Tax=Amycolatopsis mongoliensis TaxID=715475 RepID=A0A9Y2JQA2_9PSEU|nr:hypothetical protein [Amycolatopsis sp. 4-36]WIY01671.1 hypothetical protein QRX60_47950 [Amycolatopsis sp. 4-36]